MQPGPPVRSIEKKSNGSKIPTVLLALMSGTSVFLGWSCIEKTKTIESVKKEQITVRNERDSLDAQLMELQAEFDLLRETHYRMLEQRKTVR